MVSAEDVSLEELADLLERDVRPAQPFPAHLVPYLDYWKIGAMTPQRGAEWTFTWAVGYATQPKHQYVYQHLYFLERIFNVLSAAPDLGLSAEWEKQQYHTSCTVRRS